jgi:Protein of unknown function (DUF3987)
MSREQVRATIENATEAKMGLCAWPTIDEAAYYGLAGAIAHMIEPHTESASVAILLNAHVMFGNVIGRGPHYQVEGTEHHANLFVLQVGDTAKARKGTAADRMRQLFRLVDPDWSARRIHTGLSSGEGVIWEVRDAIKKSKDGCDEIIDAGISDKRLMVIESEFAGLLRVMKREGNIVSRILRDAWDRGDLATLTKNSPARATGAHVSIAGHITASELLAYLDRTEVANGFANRFLIASVRRSKLLPFGGKLEDEAIVRMASKVEITVAAAKKIKRVSFTNDAAAGWEATYPAMSADQPGLLGALTARAEAQVIRLALLYALWDQTAEITIDHLKAAIAVWEYCKASVEYLFGDAFGDVVADTILPALRVSSVGLTRTDISNLFSRNVASHQIARALQELARRGLARCQGSAPGAGRPAETWHAT